MIRLALYEPDIPQNAGTMMRLCACLGLPMDIIEPCGFALTDKGLRRAGMDYLADLDLTAHRSWLSFTDQRATNKATGRLVLLSTQGDQLYTEFDFDAGDTIIVGRESAGVPSAVHSAADAVLRVPMLRDARSLNVAITAAMVVGEAMRQAQWPNTI